MLGTDDAGWDCKTEHCDLFMTLHLYYLSLFNLKGHACLKQPVPPPSWTTWSVSLQKPYAVSSHS